MAEPNVPRRLAAILAADVAGYSRLTGADEEGTLARLRALRYELINPAIASNRGRVVKTTGDGILIEFASAVDAMRCAVEVQRGMIQRNLGLGTEHRLDFRVGIHVGDVVVEGDDLLGDGVNVAARLEGIAPAGGICLSEDAWRQVDGKVAAAFIDLGEQALKNIARPVRVYRAELPQGAPEAAPAVPPRPTLALPDKPSLAVLPFTNMSGDAEQEYFADGVVEDIITALSRMKWLFVIARNSSFAYKGKSPDVRHVGRELGVRYVLEGSVRKAAARVRITGQLIDATSGAHIWADRFEGALEDIFDLQDQITASVVGAIEPALQNAEIDRAQAKPTESLDAYDFFLRALAQSHATNVGSSTDEAISFSQKAIAIDPQYASAYGLAGWCFSRRIAQGWSPDAESDHREAILHARKAIEFGADDPVALWMAGWALVLGARDFDRGLAAIDRSLSLNPNCAEAWNASGWSRWNSGDGNTAIEHLQRAMRLSPRDPLGHAFKGGIAWTNFVEGRYEEAARWAAMVLHEQPNSPTMLRCKLAVDGLLGRSAEAADTLRALLALQPNSTIGRLRSLMPMKRSEHMAAYLNGLRRAGLPE